MSTETENQGIVEDQAVNVNTEEGAQAPVHTDEDPGITVDSGINQEAVNKAIHKKHYEMRSAQEEAARLRQERDELRQKLEAQNTPQTRPEVPELPDPFDAEYNEKIVARENAIRAQIEYDARVKQQQMAQQEQQQTAQQEQQQKVMQMVHNFANNTKKLGLKEDEVAQAETVVASYVQDPSVRAHLMSVEDGPLIVKYLASNPFELEQVARMDPITAGVYLQNKVSVEAQKLKPNTSAAPEPLNIPHGTGKVEGQDPLLDGATFF